MSDSTNSRDSQAPSFLQRWSRRKQEQAQQSGTGKLPAEHIVPEPATQPAPPQAIPDVATLDENSEVSMFFTDKVSETLKRKALRKLFHMDKFNVCDGLDDYAEDYTLFEPLGDVLTAHQRLREESESLNRLAGDEVEDTENQTSPEDVQQLAEHDPKSSSLEEQATDSDQPDTGSELKEG